jgi:hypothetical protein
LDNIDCFIIPPGNQTIFKMTATLEVKKRDPSILFCLKQNIENAKSFPMREFAKEQLRNYLREINKPQIPREPVKPGPNWDRFIDDES